MDVYSDPTSASGQDSLTQPAPRKHRRPALSCVQCRRRKVKCDRNIPCIRCTQSKNTLCVYTSDQAIIWPRDTNQMTKTSLASLPNHEGTISRSRGEPMTNNSLRSPAPSGADDISSVASLARASLAATAQLSLELETPEITTSIATPRFEPSVEELKDRVKQLETMVSSLVHADPRIGVGPFVDTITKPPTLCGSLDRKQFYGMGHWHNIKTEFDTINSLKPDTKSDKTSEIPKLLQSCKEMARAVKKQRPKSSYVAPNFISQVPTRETADILVEHYFRIFESTYRILHCQQFYKEYEQYWRSPQDADTIFVVKLLLVVAIGTLFHDENASEIKYRNMLPQWLYSAQTWLNSPDEKSRVTQGGVEVQCLLLLAQQTHSLKGDESWIAAGSLIRTAMSVGLQRDSSLFPEMTVLNAEIRRRLWSTVLELALQISLDCGMPPLFSFHDFDCEPPSNYDDADINESTKEYPPEKPDTVFTESSIQCNLRRSINTRLEICTLTNDFRSTPSYEKVLSLGTELTSHIRSNLQLYRTTQASHLAFTTSEMNLLDIMTRRFLLALHLPFAVRAKSNPKFYFSRKVALENAMVILSYSEFGESAQNFTRMKIKSGGCFRETIHRASTAVALELINQINEDSSFAFMPGPSPSSLVRKPLHEALDSAILWSKRRLEYAETNVKCHMFQCMMQAQTLAMERGEDVQKAITDAAKRSLGEACQILKKQITHNPVDGLTLVSSDEVSSGMPEIHNLDLDTLMQDTNMDFDIANTWLFDNWEDMPYALSNTFNIA